MVHKLISYTHKHICKYSEKQTKNHAMNQYQNHIQKIYEGGETTMNLLISPPLFILSFIHFNDELSNITYHLCHPLVSYYHILFYY